MDIKLKSQKLFQGSGHLQKQQSRKLTEIQALKREVKALKLERDILKKAVSIFSKSDGLDMNDDLGIDVMVAIPTVAVQAPDPAHNVERFKYNQQEDQYICPQGSKLTTTGKWHKAKTYLFKRYTTKDCKQCTVKDQCTKAKQGKGIQRSQYQQYINQNKERIENNKEYYRRRQAIVQHPYETIKRQWGFDIFSLKKDTERASADVSLMFVDYNLRRIFNILDRN